MQKHPTIQGKKNIKRYTKWLLGNEHRDTAILFYRNLKKIDLNAGAVHEKHVRQHISAFKEDGEKNFREKGDNSKLRYLDWLGTQDVSHGFIVYRKNSIERRLIWHEVAHIKTIVYCLDWEDEQARKDTEIEWYAHIYAVCLAMLRGFSRIEKELLDEAPRYAGGSIDYFLDVYEKLKDQWHKKEMGNWEFYRVDIETLPPHERLIYNAIRKAKKTQ